MPLLLLLSVLQCNKTNIVTIIFYVSFSCYLTKSAFAL